MRYGILKHPNALKKIRGNRTISLRISVKQNVDGNKSLINKNISQKCVVNYDNVELIGDWEG